MRLNNLRAVHVTDADVSALGDAIWEKGMGFDMDKTLMQFAGSEYASFMGISAILVEAIGHGAREEALAAGEALGKVMLAVEKGREKLRSAGTH